MINAAEGFRLEVLSGCLWLTRPGDAADRFLTAGTAIELHENLVLIQSDRHPGARSLTAACYRLKPLPAAARAAAVANAAAIAAGPSRTPQTPVSGWACAR
jgi:hypothetical protein